MFLLFVPCVFYSLLFVPTNAEHIQKSKVKLSLEKTTKAQRGSSGIALLFL